jgi:membrane protein YdbS with pleckstrin-like domain
MSDDTNQDDLYTFGEGETYDDGNDFQSNKNENQNQQDKQGLTKEQMMDQAVERKDAMKSDSAESLGVAWVEGGYSGKNLRSTCLLVWLVTIFFVGIGIYWMTKGMGDYAKVYWTLLLIVPVCAWVYFGCIYIYRTKTIRYRLTQHRFYNEEGLFTKTVDTLELINIEDMTLRQTLVDRVINGGTGTIVITSNDQSHPTLKIIGLENPRAAYESIDEMRRRERNARVIRSVN